MNKDSLLKLERKPLVDEICEVYFDNDFELNGIRISIFSSEHNTELRAEYKNVKIIYVTKDKLSQNNTTINASVEIKVSNNFVKTRDGIEIYSLLLAIIEGRSYKIRTSTGKVISGKLPPFEELNYKNNIIEKFIDYFTKLKRIEKYYNIFFSNISDINNESFQLADIIIGSIDNVLFEKQYSDTFLITFFGEKEEIKQTLVDIQNENIELTIQSDNIQKIILHEIKFDLKTDTILVKDPIIENFEHTLKYNLNKISVKSRSNKISIKYSVQVA